MAPSSFFSTYFQDGMFCSREAESLRNNGVKESTQNREPGISSVSQSEGPYSSMKRQAEALSSPLASLPQATGLEELEPSPEVVRSHRLQSAAREQLLNHSFPGGRGRQGDFHRLY